MMEKAAARRLSRLLALFLTAQAVMGCATKEEANAISLTEMPKDRTYPTAKVLGYGRSDKELVISLNNGKKANALVYIKQDANVPVGSRVIVSGWVGLDNNAAKLFDAGCQKEFIAALDLEDAKRGQNGK